jgi:ABC-type antimicrobial peptide transport system permease subunit
MADYTTIAYWPQKIGAILLAAVGVMALILAAIGIYGVMAYSVSRRAREIGVRVALGAERGDVIALVVGRAVRIALVGLGIGGVAALGAGQLLQSQLYEVSPRDPVTFVAIMLVLGAVAVVASWIPAWRAARADPLVVLRAS